MRKHVLPLTYAPKIPKVLDGRCTQTIRAGRKFKVGDFVSFHGWEGRPYHSKWSFGKPPIYWPTSFVRDCDILEKGIIAMFWVDKGNDGLKLSKGTYGRATLWLWKELDWLAALDGIVPATGEELGKVLLAMHKIPDGGLPAQVVRWTFSNEMSGSV